MEVELRQVVGCVGAEQAEQRPEILWKAFGRQNLFEGRAGVVARLVATAPVHRPRVTARSDKGG